MSDSPVHTRIWRELPEANDPFATRTAYCHGYDVYGQMLGCANWADMLFLLLAGEAPSAHQSKMLNALAVALANPGPRDPMVHAAMCGGVGGSQAAASLMAALAVGAGQSGGARDVYLAMRTWARCQATCDADRVTALTQRTPLTTIAPDDAGWPEIEHPAGFAPHGVSTPTIVMQTLECLAGFGCGPRLVWLREHLPALEAEAGMPLSMAGVAAAAFADLGFSPAQGEMLHLMLRLPGAAAHTLEQVDYGFKRFPYPDVELEDDPLHAAQTSSEATA